MSSLPKIAIVGGGPGGLTLGLLLLKHNIPFTIYERRSKPTDNDFSQFSGMLDLHAESGILALKKCGLYDDFLPLTGECSQEFLIADRNGTILHNGNDGRPDDGNDARSRPEISRNNLLKLLLSNLPPERIKWGHKLVSASPSSQGTVTLTSKTQDQEEEVQESANLVIGADGAWSKVRSSLAQLHDESWQFRLKPQYDSMQIITLDIRDISTKYPHLRALLGTGSFCSLGNHNAVFSQRGPADSARLYLWMSHPYPELAEFSLEKNETGTRTVPSSLKETLLTNESLFGSFGPVIKELITTAFDEEEKHAGKVEIRPLYSLPFSPLESASFTWPHTPGMTLLGDAAHVMPPNGEGVNAAMLDALHLVEDAILPAWRNMEASSTENMDEAQNKSKVELFNEAFDPLLRNSEENQAKRAKEIGTETSGMMMIMFGEDDAAKDVVDFFKGMMGEPEPTSS